MRRHLATAQLILEKTVGEEMGYARAKEFLKIEHLVTSKENNVLLQKLFI